MDVFGHMLLVELWQTISERSLGERSEANGDGISRGGIRGDTGTVRDLVRPFSVDK